MKKYFIALWLLVWTAVFWKIPAYAQEAGKSPANPIHHCTRKDDGTDTTDWDYVWFGSYPQTEVTGSELTEEIREASYDENGDALVNGIRYRRISIQDVNNTNFFGDSDYRYFKWERIKWRVLWNDGETLFVMADQGLDCKNYHQSDQAVRWENCTLREWLNGDFYSAAFDNDEKEAIIKWTVKYEDNEAFNQEPGVDTEDFVYLLSTIEATNPDYGFCQYESIYSSGRRLQVSDYAHVMGADDFNGVYADIANYGQWWLRSANVDLQLAGMVGERGIVFGGGTNVYKDAISCAPVLHIDFLSNLWTETEEGAKPDTDDKTEDTTDISSLGEVVLDQYSYIYNGRPCSPAVYVFLGDETLRSGVDYQVSYENHNTVGQAVVKVNGIGKYTGMLTQTFEILPKGTSISGKIKAKTKGFTVKWKKQSVSTTGYQIQYSLNKKFTSKKSVLKTVNSNTKTKLTVKKLKAGKKYYVRVRTYTAKGKTKYYSAWSNSKSVKTLK